MENLWILAQAGGEEAPESVGSTEIKETPETEVGTKTKTPTDPNAGAKRERGPGGILQSPLFLIGIMVLLFYFILFRGPRKKQQQHRQMVQSLQKNDRVRTIGGIIGTIVDIKEDEITLKVDESTNTKIKVSSSAIGKNLSKEEK